MSTATITVQRRSSGLHNAAASEWTKLWTVRSSWLNVAAAVVLTGLLAIQFGFSTAYDNTHLPPGEIAEKAAVGGVAVSTMTIVQVIVAAFAMLLVTSEYSTGSIRSTLQWTPVRRNVVLAKAIVLAPVLFAYALVLGAVAAITGGLTMGEWADWDLTTLVVDLLSVAAYLTLAALFTAGIAFIIRSTAGTLTAAFLLLIVIPLMLAQSSIRALTWLAALLPGGAGQNYLTGTTDPLSPTASFFVLVAWAVGGLWAGATVLQRRDA
ncbi:ABC transporter permease [Streptomyces sp. SID13031]|uniref:ABC transporter permease n=1 Tax=Streptomyces sp. SID13031 TaxID=2706046 RepID=UPI0013C76C0F|nr:ABC transporter permease [Streptomyces sp. SID13031]NEA32717.1 ABC transporter permease subunit [Streptomyces sp. SID13031]